MQQFCHLSAVKQRITLGESLPFNVRDADHTLLLACGQVIDSQEQMEALFHRGALVDVDELKRSPVAEVHEAPTEALPGLWGKSLDRVGTILKASLRRDFASSLEEAAKPALALVQRDPDLAIFQIVRQEASRRAHYGLAHSMHAAIATYLAATRLGWDKDSKQRLFKAALTMNLSVVELQGRLAMQVTPLTAAQRERIRAHPAASAQLLREAGVEDELWLQAVSRHHEAPDDRGDAAELQAAGEWAALLHRADVYTAKLSPRVTRTALLAHEAARGSFTADRGHPMTAALIKEFGIYPPGCCVRLPNGEMGVVIRRGETTTTPIVASLTDRHGDPMLQPLRRDTAQREHAVTAAVNEKMLRVRISTEQLTHLS